MKKDLTIYFDMDGVLADFDRACKEMKHIDEQPWLTVPKFFRNLQAIGTPRNTIECLQDLGYKVKILSAVDMRGQVGLQRGMDKIEWLQEHIPSIPMTDVILVPYGEKKTDHIHTPMNKSVLVDDYKVNLHNWKDLGGIAIKFGNKWKQKRPYFQVVKDLFQVVTIVESLGA